MKRILLFILCCSWVCFSGCGEKLPSDFPKVYPMTVTVTDGTAPLSDVKIMCYQVDGTGAFASSGSTDANGVARISTAQGAFNKAGIPAGDYVVTVEDVINIGDDVSPAEKAKMSIPELSKLDAERKQKLAAYVRKVPETLNQRGSIVERSPIRFTATEGKNELPINVAEYK